MTAHLTATEARALGLDQPARRARTTRRTAPGAYATRCHTCGATFTTQAAEDRHLTATGHPRYDLPIPTRQEQTTP